MTKEKQTGNDNENDVQDEHVTPASEPYEEEIIPDQDQKIPDDVEALRQQLGETHDRVLRLYSEFENYKKRVLKERIELFKTAAAEMIISLLPVLDDFDRALKAMEAIGAEESELEGVRLIYTKLFGILEQKGLSRMESIGKEFDTELHDAITKVPATDESQKGKVVDEVASGYFLNGKVIRHARVIVAG